jgi:hypothetical protein
MAAEVMAPADRDVEEDCREAGEAERRRAEVEEAERKEGAPEPTKAELEESRDSSSSTLSFMAVGWIV